MDQGNHLADARFKKLRQLVAMAQAAANGAATLITTLVRTSLPR